MLHLHCILTLPRPRTLSSPCAGCAAPTAPVLEPNPSGGVPSTAQLAAAQQQSVAALQERGYVEGMARGSLALRGVLQQLQVQMGWRGVWGEC